MGRHVAGRFAADEILTEQKEIRIAAALVGGLRVLNIERRIDEMVRPVLSGQLAQPQPCRLELLVLAQCSPRLEQEGLPEPVAVERMQRIGVRLQDQGQDEECGGDQEIHFHGGLIAEQVMMREIVQSLGSAGLRRRVRSWALGC